MSEYRMMSKRLAPMVAMLGFLAASATAVHAEVGLKTIRIQSGQQSYSCTLNSFAVTAAGVVDVQVAGCPELGAGGSGNDGGDTGNGGNDGGGTGNGGNDGGGAGNGGNDGGGSGNGNNNGGGSVGGADPGVGTWSPALNAEPRLVVVDQSGGEGTTKTIVPACVNGGDVSWGSWCSGQSQYQTSVNGETVSVRLTKGQILGVRYPLSGTSRTGSTGVLRLSNPIGGALGVDTKISLSSVPGDMSGGGQARCVNQTTTTPSVTTGTTAFACKIDRSKSVYYLNIQVQQDCSGSSCIFDISEESAEFK